MPWLDNSPLEYRVNNAPAFRRWEDTRAPTAADYKQFRVGDHWLDKSAYDWWICTYRTNATASWERFATAAPNVEEILPDAGVTPVVPSALDQITFTGGTGIQTVGGLNTVTWDLEGDVLMQVTAEDATTCSPAVNNLNIVGTATNGINTTAAGSTLTVAMASPYADGDFVFQNNTVATPRVLEVQNTDGDGGSYSALYIQAEATGGDAYATWLLSGATRYFSMGIDNSDSDYFKFTHNVDPSSGNDIFMVNPAADTFTHYYANILQTQNLVAGGVNIVIQNTNNTNTASDAFLRLHTGGAAAGDPFVAYLVDGAGHYAMGIDNTVANDPFKLTDGNSPSDGNIIINVASTGAVSFLTGNVDVTRDTVGAGTVSLTIANTDNTAAASNAANIISVGGTTSTGDPYIQWLITGSTTFSAGIDNSDADAFKIGPNADPSTGNSDFEIDPATGAITFNEAYQFPVTDGTAAYPLTTDGAGNLDFTLLTVPGGGTGLATITDHALVVGSGTAALTALAAGTTGELLIGATGADPAFGTIAYNAGFTFSNLTVANPISLGVNNADNDATSTASIHLATPAGGADSMVRWEVTGGAGPNYAAGVDNTDSDSWKLTNSSDPSSGTTAITVLSDSLTYIENPTLQTDTGFASWDAAGPYFDDTTLGDFELLVAGTGYIQNERVTWTAPQTVSGMTAGNCYWIYIDSTGTIQKTAARTDALFEDNIVLFECLRDSTPVTNNQITVKENHPYEFPVATSNYLHDNVGTVIENMNNGANITLNGTQGIQINGTDYLADHGLETTIPDSAAAAVTWNKVYTTAGGKWALYNTTNTFLGVYNNAGTPAAIGVSKFAVYTLYASKDNLNAATPVYFAVLDDAQYNNQTAADTAIANQTIAKVSNELSALELCQLGYIIFGQAANAIVQVIIEKATLKSTTSTAGTNQASLVNTITTNFDGWLSAADTNVQAALETLEDVGLGVTPEHAVLLAGAGYAIGATAVGATGELLIGNTGADASFSTSSNGDFTFTSSTAGTARTLTVVNTDNTAAAGDAVLDLKTGGTTSTGDPYVHMQITGSTEYSLGIDNTSTGDILKITTGATPSAGTELFQIGNNGVKDFVSFFDGGAPAAIGHSTVRIIDTTVGGNVGLLLQNGDNSDTSSDAGLSLIVGGTSAGDPFISLAHAGAVFNIIGVDNSDSDKLIIGSGGTRPSNTTKQWVMTTAGERTMPLQPAFLATHSAAQNDVTGTGSYATVDFTTEIFDQNADYDGSNLFTAPVTGRYLFTSALYINGAATATSFQIRLVTSNQTYTGLLGYVFTTEGTMSVTTIADMDAADTAYVQGVARGMAGDTADFPSNVETTYFTGALIC